MSTLLLLLFALVCGCAATERVFYLGEYHEFEPELEFRDGRPPAPIYVDPETAITQVLIAAFRETRCGRTLFHMFDKAKRPHLLRVSLVDQVAPDDPTCLDQYCEFYEGDACPYKEFIYVKYIDADKSKGPCLARGIGEKMLEDEAEFCLQIDSHSLFIRNWDDEVRKEWYAAENEYGVLTTYINNIDRLDQKQWVSMDDDWLPHLCKTMRGTYGSVRNEQAEAAISLKRPKMTMTWGAGFSYAKCHFERTVPNDPNLVHIFDGEEYNRFTRAWTRGYDSYTPSRNTVFHDYTPVKSHWQGVYKGDREAETQPSLKLLAMLWDMPELKEFDPVEAEKYRASQPFGIGTCRTYAQLEEFSDVRTSGPQGYRPSHGTRCANLSWVPYDIEACHKNSYKARVAAAAQKNPDAPVPKQQKKQNRKEKMRRRLKRMRDDVGESPSYIFWGVFWLYLVVFLILATREIHKRRKKKTDHMV